MGERNKVHESNATAHQSEYMRPEVNQTVGRWWAPLQVQPSTLKRRPHHTQPPKTLKISPLLSFRTQRSNFYSLEGRTAREREMEAEAQSKTARHGKDNGGEINNGISAVIPGWFSEMSPMWPGDSQSLSSFLLIFNWI